MNVIRDDFPKDVKDFFKKLENYLDTDLYFYGSVNRSDYIHNKSDIDIAIFTDNEYSTINKLQHILHVKRNAFDKIIWKLNGNMLYGYKIMCEKYINIKCEIVIYNNNFKEIVLDEIKQYNSIPLYLSFLLFILKTLYYTFPIISKKTYAEYKRYLFNAVFLRKKDTIFFLLKQS
jgi:hypothetical protein